MGKHWLEVYGAEIVATPQKSAHRAWPEATCKWASGKRQVVEGVIDQLKDIFCLERHRAKTLDGMLARLAAKVTAYAMGQTLNVGMGRPLRRLADLLI